MRGFIHGAVIAHLAIVAGFMAYGAVLGLSPVGLWPTSAPPPQSGIRGAVNGAVLCVWIDAAFLFLPTVVVALVGGLIGPVASRRRGGGAAPPPPPQDKR